MGNAYSNIPAHAEVVRDTDVETGWWDHEARTFDTSDPYRVNAVRVIATRDTSRSNALNTSFLGVLGFLAWDINAIATAAPLELHKIECRANGLFAGGTMEQTSNNSVRGPYCMYGDTSFKISQNNVIECGVLLMTPDPSTYHNGTPPVPTSSCNEDYVNLTSDQMIAQSFAYGTLPVVADLEYQNAKAVLQRYVDGQPVNDPFRVIPPWVTNVQSPSINKFNNDARKGDLVPGTLYNVSCSGSNKKLELTGFVQNIAVFTDCEIRVDKDKDVSALKPLKTESGKKALCDPDDKTCSNTDWLAEIDPANWSCDLAIAAGFESYTTGLDTAGSGTYRDGSTDSSAQACGIEPGANGVWDNVLVFTSHLEGGNVDQKAITFPNNIQLGRIDGCTEGGGVRIYSAGSVDTPSGITAHGVQIVTLGSVQFSAKANGAMGLNIQAMNDIKYTANGLMGGCDPEKNAGATEVVVTVRPVALVD